MSSTSSSVATPSAWPKLSVIHDDRRSEGFVYTGNNVSWTLRTADHWFNSTVSSLTTTTNLTDTRLGTIRVTFNGTAIAFIGSTPPSSLSQFFTLSIDGKTLANTSYSDPNPPTYRQWYQSPTLTDGLHTITLYNLSSATTFDFAAIEVGKDTSLTGEIVIVDNEDSLQDGGVKFNTDKVSTWRSNRDKFNLAGFGTGFAYGNSTHDTSHVGSSFTFRFSGTGVAIYGIYDFSNLGKLTLSFTIDSQSLLQTYQVTPTTPQFINEQGQEPNFKFYSYDFLTAGEHTLVVNVTECVNQTFRFDYLTYVPAFGKVSDMPTDLLTWASASGSGSGSTGGGGGGGKTSIGVIVGSVVGVLAGSVLLGVLLFFFLRRRKSATGEKGPERSDIQYFPLVTPFPVPNPNVGAPHSISLHTRPSFLSSNEDSSQSPTSAWTTTTSHQSKSANADVGLNGASGLGQMSSMQNESAIRYGLTFPHAGSLMVRNSSATASLGPGLPTRTSRADVLQGIEEAGPPSYDEVTHGSHR